MSQMIFTGDQDSSVRKIFCQFFIAFHVLCHSVYYLHNSFYLTVIGCITYCMDTVLAIPGVKVEFFFDHKTSLIAENHRTHKTNVNLQPYASASYSLYIILYKILSPILLFL